MAVVTLGSNYNDRVDSSSTVIVAEEEMDLSSPDRISSTSSLLIGETPMSSGSTIVSTSSTAFFSHSSLTDLTNDDHSQYHNDTRGDIRYLYKENTDAFTPDADYEPATKKYVDDNVGGASITVSDTTSIDLTLAGDDISGVVLPAGVDHDSLLNTHDLTSDIDHNSITNTHNLTSDITHNNIFALQGGVAGEYYHLTSAQHTNVGNLDSMAYEATTSYYTAAALDAGQLDTIYYTETELDGGQLDTRYYTETEIDGYSLSGDLSGTLSSPSVVNDSHTHDTRYYTETEISTSNPGSVLVHWDNLVGTPSLSWDLEQDSTSVASVGFGAVVDFRSGTGINITDTSDGVDDYSLTIALDDTYLTDAYKYFTDSIPNTATASGSDTFKLRSADNKLTILVTNNDATHGDNALFTVNEANITHNNLTGLDGGAAGEYNHLTDSELTKLTGIASSADNYGGWNLKVEGSSQGVVPSSVTAGTSYVDFVGGTNISISHSTGGDADQDILTFNATNTTYSAGDGLDLSGTTFSVDLHTGGGLKFDGAGVDELAVDTTIISAVGHTHDTGDLTDWNITSVTDGEVLVYDTGSSKWINNTLAEAGISATGHTHSYDNYQNWIVDIDGNGNDSITSGDELRIDAGSGISITRTSGVGWFGLEIESTASGCSFGLDNQIPYTNSTVDDFDYSSSFTYNGSQLYVYRNAAVGAWGSMTLTNAAIKVTDNSEDLWISGHNIVADGSTDFYIGTAGAGSLKIGINDSEVAEFKAAGLDVTGTVDVSNDLYVRGGTVGVYDQTDTDRRITLNPDASSDTHGAIYYYDEGTSAFYDLRIGANSSNNGIYYDASEGFVGIFDDSPSYRLDVNGTGRFTDNCIADQFELPFGSETYGLVANMQAGENLSAGDVVFIAADGDLEKADADASGEYPAIGIVLETINSANQGAVLLHGVYYSASHGLSGTIYLSTTTGAMTDTAPSTTGDCVQVLGHSLGTNKIYFNPSMDVIILS